MSIHMKNTLIISFAIFLISCGPQEKSITDGEIVDSLQNKTILAIDTTINLIDSNVLIIPGKSIGYIYLNEVQDSIISKLGKPDAGDAGMGKSVSIYKNTENNSSFKIYYTTNMGAANEASRAKLFHTNSTFFSTENKIRIGSGLEEIKKYFPQVKHLAVISIEKDTFQLYDAVEKGIAFEMDKENICRGITLHTAGEVIQPTYLPFYQSFKLIKK